MVVFPGTLSNHTRYVITNTTHVPDPAWGPNSVILEKVLIKFPYLKVVIVIPASWGCLWGNK